jgi:hypothetical protein
VLSLTFRCNQTAGPGKEFSALPNECFAQEKQASNATKAATKNTFETQRGGAATKTNTFETRRNRVSGGNWVSG